MGSTKLELVIADRQRRLRRSVGEELRRIREDQGLSVRAVSRAAGLHHSHLARIEAGERDASHDSLVAYATVMGHAVSTRLFPSDGPLVRDHLQVRMIEALLRELNARWVSRLEVPVYRPARGVIDLVLQDRQEGTLVAGEGHSVLTAVERQLRWASLKADSLPSAPGWPFSDALEVPPVTRLLLLRSCSAMHDLVAAARATFRAGYPGDTRTAVKALTDSDGTWPGAAIVWVDVRGSASRLMDREPRALRNM
ncbi:MAG TPA: helix-turn-helix domain-containing protein [Candidatus Limnocylindrales bacterium]|jgi:transcriptional regulator with XRE-family HTH domain|nr:helix-turn-helix domain-containing protein [Candidatus Limnocylindrales bacterium]